MDMQDRHIYYPDRGWYWKWIIGIGIWLASVYSFVYLMLKEG